MDGWVLVIDDDTSNLTMANRILSGEGLRASCVKSGEAALRFLESNRPELILLDVHMPDMDGFATITEMKKNADISDIPVIFLTADDDNDTETRGLRAGAVDFIRKPFVPEVLILRVKHTIELTRLQADLVHEVEKKTEEVMAQHMKLKGLTMQIVKTLSGAIDAKDKYTDGHSLRVAEYSVCLARELGYSEEELSNLRHIALLHDIGKISIPDSVLNKHGKLTDMEYEIMKSHTVVGGEILDNISMLPDIRIGARYHHERYDGHGYPDGLSGEDIPEIARIISIADSYDAMNSRRVYRNRPDWPDTGHCRRLRGGGGRRQSDCPGRSPADFCRHSRHHAAHPQDTAGRCDCIGDCPVRRSAV